MLNSGKLPHLEPKMEKGSDSPFPVVPLTPKLVVPFANLSAGKFPDGSHSSRPKGWHLDGTLFFRVPLFRERSHPAGIVGLLDSPDFCFAPSELFNTTK